MRVQVNCTQKYKAFPYVYVPIKDWKVGHEGKYTIAHMEKITPDINNSSGILDL